MNYERIEEVRKHWPDHEVNVRFKGYCIVILVRHLCHGSDMLSYVWTSGECETLDEAVNNSLPSDEEKAA